MISLVSHPNVQVVITFVKASPKPTFPVPPTGGVLNPQDRETPRVNVRENVILRRLIKPFMVKTLYVDIFKAITFQVKLNFFFFFLLISLMFLN